MSLERVVTVLIFILAFSVMVSAGPNLRDPEPLPFNRDTIMRSLK